MIAGMARLIRRIEVTFGPVSKASRFERNAVGLGAAPWKTTLVTALAFTLGSVDYSATIDVSVNGSALTPLGFSYGNPPIFLGLTDTRPITDISFTIVKAQYGGGNTNYNPGEIDVIGSYSTATAAAAPEIDPASATSAMTLLFGGLLVLRGRRPGQRAA